jgi:hypothetical protein
MRSLVLAVFFMLACAPPAAAQMQAVVNPVVGVFVGAILDWVIRRMTADAPAQELKDIKAEVERIRKSVEDRSRPPCSNESAGAYVRCVVTSIEAAHKSGRLDDAQAKALLERLAAALGAPVAPPVARSSEAPRFPDGGIPAASRKIGPDTFCIQDVRPDGTLRAGIFDIRRRQADWVEIRPDRRSATLVSRQAGAADQRKLVRGLPLALEGRVKQDFVRSMFFSPAPTDGPTDPTRAAANLYFDAAGRTTIYMGTYRGLLRDGRGCYFGVIAIQPRFYKQGRKTLSPTGYRN